MSPQDRLPDPVIDIIRNTDMIYFGTSFKPSPEEFGTQSPYLGMNNRGGNPGFLRVRNDGRTIVLPDYSGNKMLMCKLLISPCHRSSSTSLFVALGNLMSTPLATFAVADFVNGAPEVEKLVSGNRNFLWKEKILRQVCPPQNIGGRNS